MQNITKMLLNTEGEVLALRRFGEYQDAITGDMLASGETDSYAKGVLQTYTRTEKLDLFGEDILGDAFAVLPTGAIIESGDWLISASGTIHERIFEVEDINTERYRGNDVYLFLTLKKR